jgi:hypothetical protein
MFTKSERKLLKELINVNYALQALDSNYDSDNEKDFKEEHGISFKKAEKLLESIISKL